MMDPTHRSTSCPGLSRASTSWLHYERKTWMAGTSPAMTNKRLNRVAGRSNDA
jgi:hypothetical protein